MEKAFGKTVVSIFNGHIVHCRDIDGGDEFNIEVLVNQNVSDLEIPNLCEIAAQRNELVTLSGNSFEFEYIQPSGKIVKKTVTTTKEELAPTHDESQKIIDDGYKLG